jgi:hypothetical protein
VCIHRSLVSLKKAKKEAKECYSFTFFSGVRMKRSEEDERRAGNHNIIREGRVILFSFSS